MTRDATGSTDAPPDDPTAAEPAATDPPASLTDPDALRDRPGVDVEDRTARVPPGEFEEHDRWAGIAVVAVTDGDGRAVLLWNDDEHGLLPHAPVEPGDDFATAARRAAEEQVGVAVDLDAVVRVRRTEYRPAGDDARRTTVHDVLFRASPAGRASGDDAPTTDRGCWTAAWADDLPPNPDWDRPDVRDDLRRFLG